MFRAVEDIKAGEEIMHDYMNAGLKRNRRVRREMLSKKYGFDCECRACAANLNPSQMCIRNPGIWTEMRKSEKLHRSGAVVLNKLTREEHAKLEEAKTWYENITAKLSSVDDQIRIEMVTLAAVAPKDSTKESRERRVKGVLVKHMVKVLSDDNKFGLSEEVVQRFVIRAVPRVVEVAEKYYQNALKVAPSFYEKSKG